ncbi:MAG: DUF778 domain-containing protein [Bdellovibrionales bacterium]|nr:DUF778 domain-containing protein [Bdellovibrionales bacterium]
MQVLFIIVSNNCHHHVADVLNRINYQNRSDWSQVSIWWMCIWNSTYVSIWDIFKLYIPFLLTVLFLIFIVLTAKHAI